MTKLLAIETSSEACSIAIRIEGRVYSFHEVIPKQHSKKIIGGYGKSWSWLQVLVNILFVIRCEVAIFGVNPKNLWGQPQK